MSHVIGNAIQVHLLNGDHARHNEVYEELNQLVGPNNPLYNINEAQYRELEEFFYNYKYVYTRTILRMYFLLFANLIDVTYVSAVHKINEKKFLKN